MMKKKTNSIARREPDERWFQRQFLRLVKSLPANGRHSGYLAGSRFFEEVPLFYDQSRTVARRDVLTPDYRADIIELDSIGRLHLWEAKVLHSEDLIRGKVVGQLIFYDWLFSSAESGAVLGALKKKGLAEAEHKRLSRHSHLAFTTWNILVCGGEGWELAAGENPIMWTYPPLKEYYFQEEKPELNVYHFYKCSSGYDLRHIFELSIFFPEHMHEDAYNAFLRAKNCTQAQWAKTIAGTRTDSLVASVHETMTAATFLRTLGRAMNPKRPK